MLVFPAMGIRMHIILGVLRNLEVKGMDFFWMSTSLSSTKASYKFSHRKQKIKRHNIEVG